MLSFCFWLLDKTILFCDSHCDKSTFFTQKHQHENIKYNTWEIIFSYGEMNMTKES